MMPSRRSMRQPLSTVQETDVTIEDSGQGAQSTRRSISSLLESSRGSVLGSENMEKTIGTPSSTTTAKSLASDGKKMNDPRLPIAQEYLSNDAVLLRKCRLLLDVRDELLRAMNDDPLLEAEFLTHSEMALIFSKIETFVALYEPLVTELERAIENWTGVKAFCKAILSRSDELKSAYPPYITKNDEIKATLDGRMKQSPRLMEFIRNIERRPEFERSRVADLLMAPVQRLPQSLATLKEMAKKSSIVWRGRTKVNLVTALVESVLKMANDRREHNDKMMELLSLLNNIDGLPSTMVSAQQSLTMSADAISLGGCIMPGRLGSRVRIYCFAHGLTVVKVRSEETSLDQTLMMPGPSRNSNSHGGGMIRKLARSLSSVSLRSRPSVHLARMGGTGRKPFKFVTNISFTNIRRIRRINIGDVDDVNDDEDDEQQQQQRSLYLIVVRNNADEGWLLTADPNAPADRALLPLLEEISDTIYHTHNRIVGCDQEAVDEGYVAARSIADENLGDLIEDLNMNGSIQKAQKWLGSAIGGGGPSAMHATRNLDASTWSLTSMQSSVRLPHFHP